MNKVPPVRIVILWAEKPDDRIEMQNTKNWNTINHKTNVCKRKENLE